MEAGTINKQEEAGLLYHFNHGAGVVELAEKLIVWQPEYGNVVFLKIAEAFFMSLSEAD